MVPNYFLYSYKCPDFHFRKILSHIWAIKHFSASDALGSRLHTNQLTWQNLPVIFCWFSYSSSIAQATKHCIFLGQILPSVRCLRTVHVCAFVCGLSGEEIKVRFVLPFKDDAVTIFLTMCVCACSLIMRMRRDNKKGHMRFRAQAAICDWRQKFKEGHF